MSNPIEQSALELWIIIFNFIYMVLVADQVTYKKKKLIKKEYIIVVKVQKVCLSWVQGHLPFAPL